MIPLPEGAWSAKAREGMVFGFIAQFRSRNQSCLQDAPLIEGVG